MEYISELKDEERNRLFNALKSLRLGDSMDLVKQTLGKPGSEFPRSTKTGGPPGNILLYHVKRVNPIRNNAKDHSISLYFNQCDQLECIGYSHIEPFFGEIIPRPDMAGTGASYAIPPAP